MQDKSIIVPGAEPGAEPGRRPLAGWRETWLGKLAANEMAMAVGDQILVSGTTFLIGIAAARLLGLEQFGQFAMVLILAGLVQAFVNSLLASPMMTLAGRRQGRSVHYFATLLVWSALQTAIGGLFVGLIIAVALGFRDGGVPWGLAAAAATYSIAQNFHFMLRRILFARQRAWQALLLDVARYGLLVLVGLAWWLLGHRATVSSVLWLLASTALFSAVPVIQALSQGRVSSRLLGAIWNRHWPFARWLVLMTLLTFGHEQAIALGLGFVLSDEAVGGLRAGQYLLGITHFITMAMDNFVPQGAARALSSGGETGLRTYLVRTLVRFGLPTGMLIVGLFIFAEPALHAVFGEGYAVFAPILRIFAVSYVCIFVRDIWSHYFRAKERTDVIFRSFVASTVVSLILIYPLISWWGVTGAAVVILAAHLTSTIYLVLITARQDHASAPA